MQFQISTDVIYQLQADILATVPQHIGYVTKSRPSSSLRSSPANAAFAVHNDPSISSTHWSHYVDSPPSCSEDESAQLPVLRASGGYFLIWPLYLAGSMGLATEETRRWAIKALESVGRSMGIQQALTLVRIMQMREQIEVWRKDRLAASPSLSSLPSDAGLPNSAEGYQSRDIPIRQL
jgi:hypothetical protein